MICLLVRTGVRDLHCKSLSLHLCLITFVFIKLGALTLGRFIILRSFWGINSLVFLKWLFALVGIIKQKLFPETLGSLFSDSLAFPVGCAFFPSTNCPCFHHTHTLIPPFLFLHTVSSPTTKHFRLFFMYPKLSYIFLFFLLSVSVKLLLCSSDGWNSLCNPTKFNIFLPQCSKGYKALASCPTPNYFFITCCICDANDERIRKKSSTISKPLYIIHIKFPSSISKCGHIVKACSLVTTAKHAIIANWLGISSVHCIYVSFHKNCPHQHLSLLMHSFLPSP